MSFLSPPVSVPVSLNGFWINFRVSDCLTPFIYRHAYKTAPTKLSTQPYILEQGVSLIDQGLRQITQGLAMNM
jgi:hypothetical protein